MSGKSIIHNLREFAYDVTHRLCTPPPSKASEELDGPPFEVAFGTQANKRRRLVAEYNGTNLQRKTLEYI